jgi:DNA gyrase subunit A
VARRLGQLKRLALTGLRRCERGDLGQIGLRFQQRGDALVDLQGGEAAVLGAVLGDGRSLRLAGDQLPAEDATGAGQQLALKATDVVRELVPLIQAV